MENRTFITAILIFIILVAFIIASLFLQFNKEVTSRTIACAENNKTYIHITSIEGLSTKVDYCGNIFEIKELFKEVRELK